MLITVAVVCLGVFVQIAIGRWVPSPWLTPDLTSLSMVLLILRVPGHPLLPAWVAGLCAMTLAAHHALATALAYVGTGAVVKWIAHQAEVREPSREALVVAGALGLLLAMVMSTTPVRVGGVLWALAQIGLTLACLPLARAVVDRVAVPRQVGG